MLICTRVQGSSALQIVTALQPKVAKLANYVRGQAWIAPPVGFQPLLQALGRESTEKENNCEFAVYASLARRYRGAYADGTAVAFTPKEVGRFKADSEFFWNARRAVDASLNVSSFNLYLTQVATDLLRGRCMRSHGTKPLSSGALDKLFSVKTSRRA